MSEVEQRRNGMTPLFEDGAGIGLGVDASASRRRQRASAFDLSDEYLAEQELDERADAAPAQVMAAGPTRVHSAPLDLSAVSLSLALPTDTLFSSQWHLDTASGYDINVTDVWDDYTGQGVTVSVYDQGVDSSHSDLDDNFDFANQYSTVTQAADGRPVGSGDNHGTAVAGLIGAERNGTGVVGVAYDSTLVAIYDPLSGTASGFANRLELGYAHAANFDVSNHSWGYGNAFYSTANAAFIDNFNSATWADAGAALESAGSTGRGGLGTVFVQSAGNTRLYGDDTNLHNFQNSRYTVTVAASEQDGDITTYSTPGASVMVASPGSPQAGTIVTTDRTGSAGYTGSDYTTGFNGTSAAAPIASGVVALMLEANPNLGWRDVQEILVYSARNSDPGSGSWQTNGVGDWNGGGLTMSHDFGAGLIDAHAAVRLAEVWDTQKTSANEQSISGSHSPTLVIPDGAGTSLYATSNISLAGGITIDHVEVDLNLSHTWIGDLVVTLVSPNGTVSTLVDRPGVGAISTYGSSQDNINFTLSSTQHWGEDSGGMWQLQVYDYVSGESGTFHDWTLRVYGDTETANDDFIYTDEFGSFTGDAGRKTLSDAGGTDTINAAAVSTAVSIDLAAGGTSTIAGNTLTIDGGTTIENAMGGDGADTLTGNAGANTLTGGRGDDTLEGGAGADTLAGGVGTDTASYANAAAAVTVNLADGTGYAGDAAGDSYSGIENVTGSAYGDTIRGDAGNNTLSGGAGGDWLHGDEGNDTLHGGDGTDWLSFTGSTASVSVDLGLGSGSLGDAAGDSYSGIENIWGSAYADTLTGDAGANWLYGGAGADVLDGGAGGDVASYSSSSAGVTVNLASGTGTGGEAEGDTLSNIESVRASEQNDVLTGTAVRNWLYGAGGNDLINGGAGDDALDGGSGIDSVSYSGSTAGVTVDLAAGTGSGGHAAGDTLTGFENVLGSSHNDTITGDAGANVLRGQDGDDTLEGGYSGDVLDGGAGTDTVSYAGSNAAVSVNLGTNQASYGHAEGDTFTSIENLIGSAHHDALTGDSGDNVLHGGAGGDALTGGDGIDTATYTDSSAGVNVNLTTGIGSGGDAESESIITIENVVGSAHADVLTGEAGANVLKGGAGGDTLNGAGGVDTASYVSSSAGVTVDLEAGTGTGGDAQGDSLSEIENVTGSGHDDTLTGSAAANQLDGGDGDDVLAGGAGGDTLIGGLGTDTASYAASSAGVLVNLLAGSAIGGDAAGDSFSSIENVTGSAGADTLTGDGGDNVLEGGAGGDSLDGGAGTDTASYAQADAGVTLSLADGTGTGGDAAGDSFTAIENVTGSGYNDSLTGDGAANTLSGGAGDDTLVGGAGADVLDGGAGTDTVSYAGASQAVTADLGTGTAWGGDATGDSFSDVENVTGTDYNDKLTGNADANVLSGGEGNDWIVGSGGADTLSGGNGVDWLSYANATAGVTLSLGAGSGTGGEAAGDTLSGFEHIWGSDYDDNLTGDDGNNWFVGGAGADHFDGGVGIGDTVSYASTAVGITVDLGAGTASGGEAQGDTFANIEHIRATEHDDVLTGSSGKNWLYGAGGNDTLMGGDGGDSLDGGTGTDTVTYAGASTWIGVDLLKGTGWNGDARYDTYSNVENIIGSDNGDTLKGDHGANVITGGLGNDWITGNGGADMLQGGDGTDWATYIGASAAVTVSLATGTGTQGDATGDSLSGIENLWGSDHNDTLTGDAGGNWLYGGAGADTLDGGAGGDVVSFSGSAAGVTVDLGAGTGTGGDAEGDSYTDVEHVRASNHDDTLTGTTGGNWLYGAGGNDFIDGGAGNDSLDGGTGDDTFWFTRYDGDDVINNLGHSGENDRLIFDNESLDWIGVDHLWFHQDGNDLVVTVLGILGGNDGRVTVNDWYDGSSNKLASIETSEGSVLDTVSVETMVTAMSAFAVPTGPGEDPGNAIMDALTDTATVTVVVAAQNDGPVASNDSAGATEDNAVTVTVLGNDSDPDLDTLSVAGATNGANGITVVNPDGTITYTPDADFNGTDTFTYTISDGNGGTDTATVTVVVAAQNDGPVATDDGAATNEDNAVTVTVLGNDSDLDGDTLSVTGATNGTNGTTVVNPDGTITYTPNADFNGTDTFTYTISDGNGGTDTATVTVVVAAQNDGPVATDDAAATNEDNAVTVTVLGNDSDVDGDALSVTGAMNGTNGTTVVNPDGTITYTPDADFNGTDSFTYTISDGNGGTDTATVSVTINAVNDGPVATDDAAATNEDNAVTVTVLTNDGDTEGDALSVTGATNGTNGTTVVNPDGTITYTPNADFNGTDTFTYTTSDGNGGTDTATVTVVVAAQNDGPVATDDRVTATEDVPLTIDALVNDIDVDGDTLSVTGVTQGANGVVSINPDGTILYTPDADFFGTDAFDYTISDGNGGFSVGRIDVTVDSVNDAPIAANDLAVTDEDAAVSVDVLSNDSDDVGGGMGNSGQGSLNVTGATNGANGVVTVNPDGTVTYTPDAGWAGNDSFTYTVTDAGGESARATVDVTVNAVDDVVAGSDVAEAMIGGAGHDTANYAASNAGVNVDLNSGLGSGGHAAGDTLIGIEDVVGSGFNDSLKAGAGANSLSGGAGNDWLNGGVGGDTLDGGADVDWVNYGGSGAGVTVNLGLGTGTGGDAEGDTLTSIENIWGSSHDDVFVGDAGDNWFFGGDGADSFDGGDGIADTATYAGSSVGITVNLGLGTGQGGQAEGDSFINIEHIRATAHADALTGNDANNWLFGAEGDDTLEGGAGGDSLDGGDGIDTATYASSLGWVGLDLANGTGWNSDARYDTFNSVENAIGSDQGDTMRGSAVANVFTGGLGDDWLTGRGGGDTLQGGVGIDWATYVGSAVGVIVSLATGLGSGGDAEGDSLFDIENLWGSDNADTLIGDAGENWLYGAGGGDALDGGAGNDTASYRHSTTGITVDLGAGTGTGGDAEGDTFANIENVRATEYNDTLTGDAGNNWLFGAGGNDTLEGGAGSDSLDGDGGFDTVTYANSAAGVNVDLGADTASGGDAEGDNLNNIENLTGSAHDDTLGGDAGANVLDGGAGIDTLSYAGSAAGVTVDLGINTVAGGWAAGDTISGFENVIGSASADSLTGDGGDNTLEGGAGGDVLAGGLGTDTLSYAGAAAGVTVDLQAGSASGGDAAGDSFSGFENLTGSAHADTLTGDTGANVLTGGGGDDTLNGGAGGDTLAGGAGSDTASYAGSSAAVLIDLSAGSASGGDAAGDVLSDIENVTGSDHNDTLTGDTGANVLTGGGGDDWLVGGGGSDTLAGGAGTDTVSYLGSAAGVSASLATGAGSGGDANGDTYSGIENIEGSALNDTLTGDGGDNALSGQDGNDWISGGAGADALDGGAGTDWASYSGSAAGVTVDLAAGTGTGGDAQGDTLTGIENVWGSAQDDTLTGDAAGNWLVGSAGADAIDGGAGGDVLSFSGSAAGVTVDLAAGTGTGGDAQGDTYTNVESVRASEQGDTLIGSAANNWLYGAGGGDAISGGLGNDSMVGGTGNDTYNFARGDGADTVDNRGRAADADTLRFGSGIAHDQLWFEQSGDDLVISVIGEDGTVQVTDWFSGSDNTIATIETATGDTLDVTGVNNLVTSMSGFSAPTGPAEDMPQPIRDALAVDLAANWQ